MSYCGGHAMPLPALPIRKFWFLDVPHHVKSMVSTTGESGHNARELKYKTSGKMNGSGYSHVCERE